MIHAWAAGGSVAGGSVAGGSSLCRGLVVGGSRAGRRGRWVAGGLASHSFFVLGIAHKSRRTETMETETTFRAFPGPGTTQQEKGNRPAPLTLTYILLVLVIVNS